MGFTHGVNSFIMKYLLLKILLFTSFSQVFACGNEYGYSLNGKRIHSRYFYLSERQFHFDQSKINQRLLELNFKIENNSADFKTWSDIALNLMKIGKADSSVKILEPLILQHPEEYNLKANLGTAYELTGNLKKALRYISEGYDLNPKSHRGSEWIHISILEAKIKQQGHKSWLINNEIIPINRLKKMLDTIRNSRAVDLINSSFFYQIRTRVPFTPAPNKVICNLLIGLGDFNFQYGTYENAIISYAYALHFQNDYQFKNKIHKRIQKLNKTREDFKNNKELPNEFVRLIKRGRLNPSLLTYGLDDLGETLDSFNLKKNKEVDSLHLLKNQIDSLIQLTLLEVEKPQKIIVQERQQINYLYFFSALLIGFGVVFGLMRYLIR